MGAGIYAIINNKNGKMYIGYTVDFDMRMSTHWHNLRNGKGLPNKHMQSAWDKYGEKSFGFIVLEEVDTLKNIEALEQQYIEKYNANQREYGYNKRLVCRSNLGLRFSEEARRNMGDSHRGSKCYWWRREFTDEHRQNISSGKKGVKVWNKGKPHLAGEKNPRAILNTAQVIEIKRLMENGVRNYIIAETFSISKTVVSKIKNGKTWASVG